MTAAAVGCLKSDKKKLQMRKFSNITNTTAKAEENSLDQLNEDLSKDEKRKKKSSSPPSVVASSENKENIPPTTNSRSSLEKKQKKRRIRKVKKQLMRL